MVHANVSSFKNKPGTLTNSVTEYIDIIMAFETMLYEKLPHALYHLKNFSNPHKLGKNFHSSGAVLVYIRDNIQSDLAKLDKTY